MTTDLFLRVEPGVRFGAPQIRGRSAESVAGPIAGGDGVDATAEDFGLSRPEALLCCWFMAVYGAKLAGEPLWDLVWGGWLRDQSTAMARGQWDGVPDPPPFPPAELDGEEDAGPSQPGRPQ